MPGSDPGEASIRRPGESEAEKGSQGQVWPGGGWSPVMGGTWLGGLASLQTPENERGSQFGSEKACLCGAPGEVDRLQP